MMNNKGIVEIFVLMIAILIGCDSEGGGETIPAGPSNLYAWGENTGGQLGIGNNTNQNTPVAIKPTKIWKQVSAGFGHTMAIDSDDHLFAWGGNSSGQLGIGNETDQNTPVAIKPTKIWKQVSAGERHTMAIDSDGALYAWGANTKGQLGIGRETVDGDEVLVNKHAPIAVVIKTDATKTWKQVSAGGAYTLAIDSDNHLFAWGGNSVGQLGNGNNIDQTIPVAIESTKTWKQVSAGGVHTLAIDSDNHLFAWGWNVYGQLGNGKSGNGANHTLVAIESTKTWKQVSAGGAHTLAIDSADHLFAWGRNFSGQLGIGNETDQNMPVAIETSKTWKQVSAGEYHTVVLDSDNHLFAWGRNFSGQLGIGNETDQNTPVAIETSKTWKQVSAAGHHTLGIIQ